MAQSRATTSDCFAMRTHWLYSAPEGRSDFDLGRRSSSWIGSLSFSSSQTNLVVFSVGRPHFRSEPRRARYSCLSFTETGPSFFGARGVLTLLPVVPRAPALHSCERRACSAPIASTRQRARDSMRRTPSTDAHKLHTSELNPRRHSP